MTTQTIQKIRTSIGVSLLAFAIGMNLYHAFDHYGILKIKLHPEVLAQSNNCGSGSECGTGGSCAPGTGGGNTGSGSGNTCSGSGSTSIPSDEDIARDKNNATGWLWKNYAYNCIIDYKVVVIKGCGSFSAGAVYTTASVLAEITRCGGTYTETTYEKGIKDYCFNGGGLCWSNNNCH